MKILQLNNKVPFPVRDGGAIGVFNFSRGFHAHGHEVIMLAMNTSKHHITREEMEPAGTVVRIIPVDVPATITITGALMNFLFSGVPYTASRFISREFQAALEKLLSEENFDVVQLEGIYLAPYIPVIRKHSGAVISLRAHNIEHEIWDRIASHTGNPLKKYYLKNLARRVKRFETGYFNQADLVLPISGRDLDYLQKLGLKRPHHLIPAGINLEDFTLSPGSDDHYPSLFHLGALDWAPNLEGLTWFLTSVWPAVHARFPDLHFYIAGRNADKKFLDSLSGYPHVDYEGEVSDAYRYMLSRAVMIVPLLSGGGMRIKILEGMALGKSIVSTPVGTEGIESTHGRNIMIASNPEEFLNAISHLVENRDLYVTTGRNAREFVSEKFDNLKLTGKLCERYQSMADQVRQ